MLQPDIAVKIAIRVVPGYISSIHKMDIVANDNLQEPDIQGESQDIRSQRMMFSKIDIK
jgi:hypothetical protein